MTFAWFAAAAVWVYRRRPRGFGWMLAFLIAEIGFYLVHNASGSFARDLKFSDPILFTASVLGYLSTLTAIAFGVYLLRHRAQLVDGRGAGAGDGAGTGGEGQHDGESTTPAPPSAMPLTGAG